jgi:RNA polymerase sigma factor (sigma-70 family)
MSEKYEGVFESWEIGVTKKVVSARLLMWPSLKREGFNDLVQECLIYWLEKREGCNLAAKSKPKTYMARVLRNHLSHILERIRSAKKKPVYQSESLDDLLKDDDSATPVGNEFEIRLTDNPALKADISDILRELTTDQRRICALLGEEGLSPLQVSRRIRKHHSYVYREIENMRRLFESKGLREYLTGR